MFTLGILVVPGWTLDLPANLAQNAILSSAHLGYGSLGMDWHCYGCLTPGRCVFHGNQLPIPKKDREGLSFLYVIKNTLEGKMSHFQKAESRAQKMQRQTKKETRKRAKQRKMEVDILYKNDSLPPNLILVLRKSMEIILVKKKLSLSIYYQIVKKENHSRL